MIQKLRRRIIRTLRRLGSLEAGTEDVVATGHDPLRDDAPAGGWPGGIAPSGRTQLVEKAV